MSSSNYSVRKVLWKALMAAPAFSSVRTRLVRSNGSPFFVRLRNRQSLLKDSEQQRHRILILNLLRKLQLCRGAKNLPIGPSRTMRETRDRGSF